MDKAGKGLDKVLSLPTRNGNLDAVLERPPAGLGFEPTYKEWKQRNAHMHAVAAEEFWAYLQGMETHRCPIRTLKVPRFEPTYKEWKHVSQKILSFHSSFVLSLPTRNGNPSPKTARPNPATCFEPTYKEWKLPLFVLSLSCWSVLSLPTRNGNLLGGDNDRGSV